MPLHPVKDTVAEEHDIDSIKLAPSESPCQLFLYGIHVYIVVTEIDYEKTTVQLHRGLLKILKINRYVSGLAFPDCEGKLRPRRG